MHTRRLTIACAHPADPAATMWHNRISAHPGAPETQIRSIADLLSCANGSGLGTRWDSRMILLIAEGAERNALMRLVDRSLGAHTPVLVICRDAARLRCEFEPQGVVVLEPTVSPDAVTTALDTLMVRQAAIDHLAMDLRIAQASNGGLNGEMSRLHEELELAGKVQRRFLPKSLPAPGGYAFGALFRPCGYVSGDIYDIAELDESRIAFLVADAVGHGVPAALLTLVLGRALRNAAADGCAGAPARMLASLNEDVCQENEAGDRFATAVCGVLDRRTHRVTLASAGHPPALLIDRLGHAVMIEEGGGPLLGVFPDAPFEETSFTLGPGQTLLMYTDGFETAFPDPRDDPERVIATHAYVEKFAAAVHDADDRGGLQRALEFLAASLDTEHCSLHQRDDLTALALSRLASRRTAGDAPPIASMAA